MTNPIFKELSSEREIALNLSQSHETPSKELAKLYKDLANYIGEDVEKVRVNLAKNPNTPIEILIELSSFWIKEVAQNPAIDLILLEYPEFPEKIIELYQKIPGRLGNMRIAEKRGNKDYPNWLLKAALK